ncbi:MAG: YceI family protein [Bacteroidota bacterium]
MMKQLPFLVLALLFALSFTQIGIEETGSSPGVIQAIGDAGSPQVFTFQKWKFTEAAMPEDQVENIQLGIEINTSSLTCDWKDLQQNIRKKKDYFYIKKFPTASVAIDGATAIGDGQYKTQAMLTLKKHTKPVELTFTISESKPYQVKGEGVITRQDFGFNGGGPKDEVPISFDVTLPLE